MDFIKETLDWVNRERKYRFGLDPLEDLPKGYCNSGCDCPIARALCAEAVTNGLAIFDYWARDEQVNLPPYATRFVEEFDLGELPQYIER